MSKKLLYVKSISILSTNGDDLSALENLSYLKNLGYQVQLLSLCHVLEKKQIIELLKNQFSNRFKLIEINDDFCLCLYDNVEIIFLFSENKTKSLINYLNNYQPAVILANFMEFDLIKSLLSNKIPLITFLTDYSFKKVDLSISSNHQLIARINHVFAFSNHHATEFKSYFGLDILVNYPLIKRERYLVKSNSKQFISLINPIKEKGVDLFINLAKSLPKELFLGVGGWNHNYVKRYLTECKYQRNLKYEPITDDIRTVFSKTKILLVPSIWQESFGRVCLEAMVNGIPVITSKSCGLIEAVNDSYFNLSTDDIEKWQKMIVNLQDNDYYDSVSKKMLTLAESYYSKKQKQLELFVQIIDKYC